MKEVLMFATVLSPIVLGLIQMVKQSVKFSKSYVPLVAVLVGLFVGYAAQPFTDLSLILRLWAGGLSGLSATGLFELVTPSKGYTQGQRRS